MEEKKRRRRGRILSNILIVAGVILLIVAASMWGVAQWRYHEQDKVIEEMTKYATVDEDKGDGAPNVDWAALKAVNPDVVGWLQIPGTAVNYPVYQAKDNDYYLKRAPDGEYAFGGSVFLDYETTKPGMKDEHSIIYGHHLKNGTMFKDVADLDDQERFDAIDTIWYVTEKKTYELQPLMLYYTHPEDQEVRQFKFKSTLEFHRYLKRCLEKSVTKSADADKLILGASHVLTLSTCNYYDGYGRTLFMCIPKDEASYALENQGKLLEQEAADEKVDAEAKAKEEAEKQAKAEAKAQAEAEAQALADSEAEAQAQAQAEAEALAEEEAQAQAEYEAQQQAEAEAQAQAEAEAQAQAEAEAQAQTQVEEEDQDQDPTELGDEQQEVPEDQDQGSTETQELG